MAHFISGNVDLGLMGTILARIAPGRLARHVARAVRAGRRPALRARHRPVRGGPGRALEGGRRRPPGRDRRRAGGARGAVAGSSTAATRCPCRTPPRSRRQQSPNLPGRGAHLERPLRHRRRSPRRTPRPGPSRTRRAHGFFRRLRQNMRKTREALTAELQSTLFQTLDDEAWERLEETLIYADVGASTTARIVARLEQEVEGGELQPGRAVRGAPARAARRGRPPGGRRHDRHPPGPDGDPDGRRQRHRQDDHDRQARLAPPEGARASRCCSPRATPTAPPPSSSSRSGPSARAASSCAPSRGPTPARSPSTPSPPRRRAATTS